MIVACFCIALFCSSLATLSKDDKKKPGSKEQQVLCFCTWNDVLKLILYDKNECENSNLQLYIQIVPNSHIIMCIVQY